MCGIVAILGACGAVGEESLTKATGVLHHRGPDARRIWVSPRKEVGLGHTRLSIIDLSSGDQPIASEEGALHIVVNGEFYDFERIRAELEEKGHHFRTRSDSEIALHLYEEYGARCLRWLRGEFAFILWDENQRRLFAARDRFGIKPLYYAFHAGKLFLGSEVKALFAAGVPARWDHEMLLAGPSSDPNRTLFAGIHQVPPGHYMLAGPDPVDILPYWDIAYPPANEIDTRRDPREHVEELREILNRAVKLRLRADVPVACYLSGGLDSCAVLGIASELSAAPLRAYTLAFDHADYDERAIAQAQSKLSGADFRPIDIRSEHMAEHFVEALWHAERPFINAHCVAKYLLSRAVRSDGIKVVLTGEGADEVFAGYPHFRKDMVLYNMQSEDPESARELLDALDKANRVSQGLLLGASGSPLLANVNRILGYTPAFLEVQAEWRDTMNSLLIEDARALEVVRDPFRSLLDHVDVERRLAGRDPVNQSLYLWAKTMLPNYILSNLGDRMEMAHSVEGRLPFLDHEVVECVARMPVGMKIHGMTEKYVLREAARPVLTDEVYRRQKHPFLSPPSTLQSDGKLHELMQETLRGSGLAATGLFDRKKMAQTLDALPALDDAARTRLDPALMALLSICLLQERFGLSA